MAGNRCKEADFAAESELDDEDSAGDSVDVDLFALRRP